jgi:predicted dehydrogenase
MKTTYPDKKKIVIIGCGGWAKKICLYLDKSNLFKVDAIVCKNISRHDEFTNFEIFKSLDDLEDRSKIDGFYIAGNPEMNLQMLKNIVKYSSKIPIILEKPISIEDSDSKKIFSIYKKNKLSILLNQSNLHDPLYDYSKKNNKKKKVI